MSRVVATLLTQHFPQVEFVPMCGQLTDHATGKGISWHVWLNLGYGWLIDYKARRWLRDRTQEREAETAQAEAEAGVQRVPDGLFHQIQLS